MDSKNFRHCFNHCFTLFFVYFLYYFISNFHISTDTVSTLKITKKHAWNHAWNHPFPPAHKRVRLASRDRTAFGHLKILKKNDLFLKGKSTWPVKNFIIFDTSKSSLWSENPWFSSKIIKNIEIDVSPIDSNLLHFWIKI